MIILIGILVVMVWNDYKIVCDFKMIEIIIRKENKDYKFVFDK